MRHQAIERLLPAVYQRAVVPGGVLATVLDVMEAMHAPSEELLAAVDDLFDPYRTPDGLVPFLAGWTALDHLAADLPLQAGRRRDLVASSASLAQWRGTAAGLRAAIHMATGVEDVRIDEPADRPFHVVVRIPASASGQLGLIRRIAELEKPAATTCEVLVQSEIDDNREE